MSSAPDHSGTPERARRRLVIVCALGLVSGLPYLLTGSTLTTWLRSDGVSLELIGVFAWAQLPYTLKPLWAPLLDRFSLPWLGRRRGWMLLWQLLLVGGIAAMGLFDPRGQLGALFAVAVGVALASASLDVVVDAYRTDVLTDRERGPGGALFVTGYRVALVVAGAGALIAADLMPWRAVYALMALAMLGSVAVTLAARPVPRVEGAPRTLREAVVAPLADLLGRTRGAAVLAFVAAYKLGEGLAFHLVHPFLVDLGFSKTAIGAINKGVGLPAAVAGTLLGGVLVTRLGMRRSLLAFGLLQAAPNVLYAVQAGVGADPGLLAVVVSVDQFCGGLATAAFVAYLMSLCDRRFTAFQYAVLASVSALLGRVASGWSGVAAAQLGWPAFFIATALASLPALAVLVALPEGAGAPARR